MALVTYLGPTVMKLEAVAYCLLRSQLCSFVYSCLSKTGHHTQTRLGDMTIAFAIGKLETATFRRRSLVCLFIYI